MLPQIACTRACKDTLVAFVWLNVSIFLKDFNICILQTKVFKILLHCHVLCVVFRPNCCFKLSKIYHWLLVSNYKFDFPYHTFAFSQLNGKCLGGSQNLWQISCTNCHIWKMPYTFWQFPPMWIFPYGNFPRDLSRLTRMGMAALTLMSSSRWCRTRWINIYQYIYGYIWIYVDICGHVDEEGCKSPPNALLLFLWLCARELILAEQ